MVVVQRLGRGILGCGLALLLAACPGQNKESMVREAAALMAQDNPQGAVVLLKNALEQDPNDAGVRHQLGLAYFRAGKLEQAEKELHKARLQNPANTAVLLDQVQLYLRQQNTEAADETLQQFLEKEAKSSRSQEYLGLIRATQGDLAAAETLLQEAAMLDPTNVEARQALARLYLQQRRSDEARQLLEALIAEYPADKSAWLLRALLEMRLGQLQEALNAYQQVTLIDPADAAPYYMAGLLALDLDEVEQTRQFTQQLQQRFPNHPAGARLKGLLHFTAGELNEAANALRESLKGMSDVAGYYFLGLTEFRLGHHELALNQFQRALDIVPEHVPARLLSAMVLLQQQRVDEAIQQAMLVLRKQPDMAVAHSLLGSAYLAQKKFDLATEHLDRAIALDPTLADAHVKKGLFDFSRGNLEGAEVALEKAVGAAPESLGNRLLLATLYLRQQNYRGVVEVLGDRLDGGEQDALLLNYMAAAYLAQNQGDKAVEVLQQAKKIKPDYLAPYFNLAHYYVAARRPALAMVEYQALLQVAPENVKALVSLALLQELSGDSAAAQALYERARATSEAEGFLALAAYLGRHGHKEALPALLEEAYGLHPQHPTVVEARGRLLLQQQRYAEAQEMFEKLEGLRPGAGLPLLTAALLAAGDKDRALALGLAQCDQQPQHSSGYRLLAAIYHRLGQTNKAEEVLREGLKQVKDRRFLSLQLASLYAASDRMPRAIEELAALVRTTPDFVPGLFALATLYDQTGDKRQAVRLYREILAQDEDHGPTLNNLAYLFADNYGSKEEALTLALRAFQRDPANPLVLDTLGLALLKNGRIEEAVSILRKASQQLPEVAAVQLHLGQALAAANQPDEARQAVEAALRHGGSAEAEQAAALLKTLKAGG
ncbi:XrtA/PEP-CTERM system TPR-repeat protein PrsT [Desulfuromonas thiophila]|uniref:XrtA/PEP-CTERM system TPR-repeat protein PrsT n=1 Tax=Desulfuromonas thiophila TaxID=57664 RepID=UPI0024A85932|nr:XrtA/PEP-CTERM system TPR-repeat protein PrsT [Desulfuromonas thiophila]